MFMCELWTINDTLDIRKMPLTMLVYFYLLANLNLEIFVLFIALISKWMKLISFM